MESPDEVVALLAPIAQSAREFLRGPAPGACATEASGGSRNGGETGDRALDALLRLMSHDPVNIDQLCQRTGLTVGPLSAMLVSLELEGIITAEHGRYTRRCY